MRIWHMIYINIQISAVAKVTLGQAVCTMPRQETVVYPSTFLVRFACIVAYSAQCFSSPISLWCLVVLQSLQGTKKQIYSLKMKKFRQKFFQSFQSNWRKTKIKTLQNTFWADFKRTCFFFKKRKQKRVSFSWGIFKFVWAFLFCGETFT